MFKVWDRLEQTAMGLLGICALIAAVWQVLSRYFYSKYSISYAEELIVYLLIWGVMLGSSQLVRMDGHVRPDLVLAMVPTKVARWLEVFNCVVALIFCAAVTWYGWEIVDTALFINEVSSTDLQFPMWIYYLALPTGSALMFLRYAIRLARFISDPDAGASLADRSGHHEMPGES
ncbi:MAG TPA: TRAP transporter small permease [Afipia sp.]